MKIEKLFLDSGHGLSIFSKELIDSIEIFLKVFWKVAEVNGEYPH